MKFILIVCLALAAICFRATTDKETPDWTGTTQGYMCQDSVILHLQNCIRISEKAQREMDSVDNYMRHWYEVLDTNSNGQIDDTE